MLRTEKLGIEIENHPYDRGYWACFNGEPRPKRGEPRKGWDTCNDEMAAERSERAGYAADKRWGNTSNWRRH